MPDWLDTPGEMLAVLSIGAVIIGFLSWLIQAQISNNQQLTSRNGGSTVRAQLDRIEADLRELRRDGSDREVRLLDSVAKVHARVDEHIAQHLKGE